MHYILPFCDHTIYQMMVPSFHLQETNGWNITMNGWPQRNQHLKQCFTLVKWMGDRRETNIWSSASLWSNEWVTAEKPASEAVLHFGQMNGWPQRNQHLKQCFTLVKWMGGHRETSIWSSASLWSNEWVTTEKPASEAVLHFGQMNGWPQRNQHLKQCFSLVKWMSDHRETSIWSSASLWSNEWVATEKPASEAVLHFGQMNGWPQRNQHLKQCFTLVKWMGGHRETSIWSSASLWSNEWVTAEKPASEAVLHFGQMNGWPQRNQHLKQCFSLVKWMGGHRETSIWSSASLWSNEWVTAEKPASEAVLLFGQMNGWPQRNQHLKQCFSLVKWMGGHRETSIWSSASLWSNEWVAPEKPASEAVLHFGQMNGWPQRNQHLKQCFSLVKWMGGHRETSIWSSASLWSNEWVATEKPASEAVLLFGQMNEWPQRNQHLKQCLSLVKWMGGHRETSIWSSASLWSNEWVAPEKPASEAVLHFGQMNGWPQRNQHLKQCFSLVKWMGGHRETSIWSSTSLWSNEWVTTEKPASEAVLHFGQMNEWPQRNQHLKQCFSLVKWMGGHRETSIWSSASLWSNEWVTTEKPASEAVLHFGQMNGWPQRNQHLKQCFSLVKCMGDRRETSIWSSASLWSNEWVATEKPASEAVLLFGQMNEWPQRNQHLKQCFSLVKCGVH